MNTITNKTYGISNRVWQTIHKIVLISMLHSTIVLPAQTLVYALNNGNNIINQVYSLPSKIELDSESNLDSDKHENSIVNKEYSKSNKINVHYFSADIKSGVIGYSNQISFDSPKDNFFTISIDAQTLKSAKQYVLEYEVYGLDGVSTIAKSINNHPVTGGNVVKWNSSWSKKREVINSDWLQQKNTIFFTIPNQASYSYKVRNVQIKVEDATLSNLVLSEDKFIKTKQGKVQLQGFIPSAHSIKWLKANNTTMHIEQNSFDGIIDVTSRNTIEFVYEDVQGKIFHEKKKIDISSNADTSYDIEQPSLISKTLEIDPVSPINLDIDGFSLRAFSVENKNTQVTIEQLRKTDLAPLESGMINVTKGKTGYRVASSTSLGLTTTIELQYDTQLIPDGYSEKDIKTFYFDHKQKTWVPTHFECLDEQSKIVISNTTQQTDYINGIIQSPESPQTSAFTPTMMNDIKAADPSSQLTLISPPSASQRGDANLSYPIKIPAGRNGMQPQIGLQYNSESGNGWLGEGWNLSTPAISLDTRWGTPTFDANTESEMYVLNGEQLMFPKLNGKDWMPNRHYETNSGAYSTQDRARITNAQFTYRKQNSFDKIERIGDSPINYYWKVTSTDGTISWYGGKEDIIENAVIKNDQGNIVQWSLYMTEDVYGNNVKYYYSSTLVSNATGDNTNINGGLNYQIDEIVYTGYQGADGNYKIKFESQNVYRNDISINNMLGVKIVEPYLLNKIAVSFDDTLIRFYKLNYSIGKFNKSLLDKVIESNAEGTIENEHKFEYFDDVTDDKGVEVLYEKGQEIAIETSSNPDYLLNVGNLINASKLNSTQKTEFSWDLRPAVGMELFYVSNSPQRNFTVGFPFGESYSENKGKVSFVDINGDGWDDVLMKKNGKLIYFPRIIDEFTNGINFGSDIELSNVDEFSKSKSKTKTMFLESFDLMFGGFYVGRKRFKTNETTSVYLNDSNSDGLIDVVKNGKVYFNTGNNVFETTSANTPNLLITAATYSHENLPDPEPETTDFEYDKYDIVRVWEAPYDGKIKITDSMEFFPTTANSKVLYTIETKLIETNSVPFRIYLKEFTNAITQQMVDITNYSGNNPPLGAPSNELIVKRGQKLFFRVHKNTNIVNDVFKTSPVIQYLIPGVNTDSNSFNTKLYKHSEGFKLDSGTGEVEVNQLGNVTISWPDLPLNNLSDNTKFKITKKQYDESGQFLEENILFEFDYVANSNDILPGQNIQDAITNKRSSNCGYVFEVISDSNINWNSEDWYPFFEFSALENTSTASFLKYAIPSHTIFQEATDLNIRNAGNMNSPYVFKCNTINYSFNSTTNNYFVTPIMPVSAPSNPYAFSSTDNAAFTFVVKKNGILLGKRNIYIQNGVFGTNDSTPIPVNLTSGTDISNVNFEFYVDGVANLKMFYKYTNNVSYAPNCGLSTNSIMNFIPNAANIAIGTANELANTSSGLVKRVLLYPNTNLYNHLGGMHRNWGQFIYNSNFNLNTSIPFDQFSKLIDEHELEFNVNQLSSLYANCQNSTATEAEYENCVNNAINSQLNLPANNEAITFDNVESIVDSIAQNPVVSGVSVNAAFMQMEAKIELSNLARRWNGNFQNQYSEKSFCKAGEIQSGLFATDYLGSDSPEMPELTINSNTGMYAVDKDYRSVALSYSAGYGNFTTSYSGSRYSDLLSDFVDLNGDRYPDIISSNSFWKTTKTGGHKLSNQISLSTVNASKNFNVSATLKGGYPIAGRCDIDSFYSSKANGFFSADNGIASSIGNMGLNLNLAGSNKEFQTLLDLNGDGLTDLYDENSGIRFNYGSYFNSVNEPFSSMVPAETKPTPKEVPSISLSSTDLPVNTLPFSLNLGYSRSNGNSSKVYVDINGDGLPDLLTLNATGGEVQFNLGNKFSSIATNLNYAQVAPYITLFQNSEQTSFSVSGSYSKFKGKCVYYIIIPTAVFVIIIPFIHIKAGVTVSGSANLSISESNKEFKDMDADGHLDFVSKQGNKYLVYYSRVKRTNKLKQVTNPLGGSFNLDYTLQKASYNNPHPKWALTSVQVNDGYDLANDGADTLTTFFKYVNGRYDRRERAFYGYEKVIEQVKKEGVVYKTNTTEFHNQSYFLNGLVKKTTVAKGEGTVPTDVYSTSENTYGLYTTNSDGTINLLDEKPFTFDVGGTEGRKQASVLLKQTTSTLQEYTATGITSKVTFNYDKYGRVIKYNNQGDTALLGDEYTTTIAYHVLNNNLLHVPKNLTVSTNGQTVRYRETQANINTGEIERISVKLNNSEYAISNYTYDSYGNLIHVDLPANHQDQNMSYSYQYDTYLNKYVTHITDAFGYKSSASYDPLFDNVIQTIDLAGNEMNYSYDSMGRVIQVTAPNEQPNGYTIKMGYFTQHAQLQESEFQDCIQSAQFMPVAFTQHFDSQHPENPIETITFMDGLARAVQVKKDIELNLGSPESPQYQEYMSVSGATTIDELGRAIKQYHPTKEVKDCSVNMQINQLNDPDANYFTETQYDEINRAVKSIDPAGVESLISFDLATDVFGHVTLHSRSIANQNASTQIISDVFKDIQGRTTATNNVGPDGDIWTKFHYNSLGELMKYVDAEDLATVYEYDLAGRKTTMSNPDRGTMKYLYDPASNLIKLQTSKLEVNHTFIDYFYNYNRLEKIIFPLQNDQPNISNVSYTYGNDGEGNETGRLILQVDATGKQQFKYGSMGELVYNKRVIEAPNLPTRAFETSFVYDSFNRIKTLIYPDGEKLNYTYDLGGNLMRMKGEVQGNGYTYVEQIDYDHFEQRTYIKYGNQTENRYAYTPNLRRLDHLISTASNGQDMLNNTYIYDQVGNVEQLSNSATFNDTNQLGGIYTHSYDYDNLNRLVGAHGDFVGNNANSNTNTANYELAMEYNTTHGILYKKQLHHKNNAVVEDNSYKHHYTYKEGTHQVEKIEGGDVNEHYYYDANGNLEHRTTSTGDMRHLLWDESDRLRVLMDRDQMHHFIYDAAGNRTLKASTHYEQVFENGQLVQNQNATLENYTTYASAYLVLDANKQYSKHYYVGSERIATQLGSKSISIFEENLNLKSGAPSKETTTAQRQVADLEFLLKDQKMNKVRFAPYKQTAAKQAEEIDSTKARTTAAMVENTRGIYFFHNDHLGTGTFLTDGSGNPYQFFVNLPFGETMFEQHSYTEDYNNPYKFNGKELDEETGLYYYGARYYDPRTSIWLSIDPLMELAPNWTPYRYCFNNPVSFIDPKGLFETRKEARQYRRENNIQGRIQKNRAGGYDINNYEKNVNYSSGNDKAFSNDSHPNDDVIESAFVTNEKSSFSGKDFYDASSTGLGFVENITWKGMSTAVKSKFAWNNANRLALLGLKGSTSALYRNKIPGTLKGVGIGMGLFSLGVTGIDIVNTGQLKASNILDASITCIGFIPGYGWIAGAVYFGADIVTKGLTGKSIGNHLDEYIEEKFDKDDGALNNIYKK